MVKPGIIYIAPYPSTFVKKDIEFLSIRYRVMSPEHFWVKKMLIPFTFLRQMVFLLFKIHKAKAVFVMFGDYWSLLPALFGKIFRKPVFIIPGGTDCVSFPSLGYGSLRKPLTRRVIRMSYSLCTRLLPVDESLVFCRYSYLEPRDYDFQGYRYFFPGLKTEHTVIHNGVDIGSFYLSPGHRAPDSFITISHVDDPKRYIIKGIDKVIFLARSFPASVFTIVGISGAMVESLGELPANLVCYPFLPAEKFNEMIGKTEFYLQLSVSEGFPNALCEGMLGGCIPVVSSVGAMPMIVGESGFILERSDDGYIKEWLKEILSIPAERRKELADLARKRVIENYTMEKRGKALEAILESFALLTTTHLNLIRTE